MTADEHVREVYAHFGLAVYCGQVLEHAIVNAMVVLRLPHRDRFTKGDIDAFMDQQFENTLGKLINNLRAELPFPSDLEDLLRHALKTRNWLCHDYFRERAVEFMTSAGRNKMLAELGDAKELLSRADKGLSAVVQPLADRCGLTEAALQAEYQRLCPEQGIAVPDVAPDQGGI
jgi:hypothetical protein